MEFNPYGYHFHCYIRASFHYDVLGAARVMSDDGGSGWEEDEAAGRVCEGEWEASESCRGFPLLSENNRVWLNLDNCEMYISNAVKTHFYAVAVPTKIKAFWKMSTTA